MGKLRTCNALNARRQTLTD